MTTQILPTRFQLSPAEVSTCFARLQRIPPPLPLFSGLPVAAPHLPEAVKDAPGQLSAEARTLFSILASPSALTTVRLLWPEVGLPLEMTVLSDAARSGVVLVARQAQGDWDMALVANGAQAVLAIDGLMPVSDSDTAEPEVLGSFPAAGLGVLAALGDRLRDMDLRARLARQEVSPEDLLAPVSAQEVALFAGRGCTSPDLRSATGRLLLLAPEALEAAADMARAEAALRALRQAKVIAEDGGLSASGVLIARLLSQADPCAVFHGASVGGSGTTRDRIMVLRSGGRLFTVHWSGRTTDADAPVTVLACPPAEALRTLSTLFEAGP